MKDMHPLSNLPHGIGYHGQEEGSTADASPLNPSESAPYWPREDTPEDMVVTQHVEETSLHEKSFWGGCIHRGRRNLDLRRVLIPVYGKPAIGKEAELFTGLEVMDDDIAKIPGLHLPDSTVVVPDLEAHQMTQRPGISVKFHRIFLPVNCHQECIQRSFFEEVLLGVRQRPNLIIRMRMRPNRRN